MKGFENNKYSKKIEYLISQNVTNERLFAQLRFKANNLRKKKSLKLMELICTPKLIIDDKTFKRLNKLILTGADVNYSTLKGLTPFILASINGQILVAEFLKEKGADVFQKTKEGQNALMLTSFVSQMSRAGGELSTTHRDVRYPRMIRQLRIYGLDANMHCDFLGITLNDYYMGNFEPFTNHLLTQTKEFLNRKNYILDYEDSKTYNF